MPGSADGAAADGTVKFAVPRAKQHQLFVQAAGSAPVTRQEGLVLELAPRHTRR